MPLSTGAVVHETQIAHSGEDASLISDDVLNREGSPSDTKTFPPFFDSRIVWGERCWYPVRNQGNDCASCHTVTLADAVSNRACIFRIYGHSKVQVSKKGSESESRCTSGHSLKRKPKSHIKPMESIHSSISRPPAVSAQALLSCKLGKKNLCSPASQLMMAKHASGFGFIAQGTGRSLTQDPPQASKCPCTPKDTRGACMGYCLSCGKENGDGSPSNADIACPWTDGTNVPEEQRIVKRLLFQQGRDLQHLYHTTGNGSGTHQDLGNGNHAVLLTHQPSGKVRVGDLTAVLASNKERIKRAIMERGPVVTSFLFNMNNVTSINESVPYVSNPVSSSGKSGHSIKLIGWATLRLDGTDTPVWICQNSWGSNWGGKARLDENAVWSKMVNKGSGSEKPSYPSTFNGDTKGYFFLQQTSNKHLSEIGHHKVTAFSFPEFQVIAPVPSRVCSTPNTTNAPSSTAAWWCDRVGSKQSHSGNCPTYETTQSCAGSDGGGSGGGSEGGSNGGKQVSDDDSLKGDPFDNFSDFTNPSEAKSCGKGKFFDGRQCISMGTNSDSDGDIVDPMDTPTLGGSGGSGGSEGNYTKNHHNGDEAHSMTSGGIMGLILLGVLFIASVAVVVESVRFLKSRSSRNPHTGADPNST